MRRLARRLLGLVLAPDLGESEEIALCLGVAVDLVVDGFAFLGQGIQQRHVGDAQTAIIGGVFAQGELAVELCLRARLHAPEPPQSRRIL